MHLIGKHGAHDNMIDVSYHSYMYNFVCLHHLNDEVTTSNKMLQR